MKFVHLSDLHIGALGRTSKLQHTLNIFRGLVKKKAEHGVNTILITGDIVNSGFDHEYRQAQAALNILTDAKFEVLVIPGNHDYGFWGIGENANLIKRFSSYFSVPSTFPYYIIDKQGIAFVLLDSMQCEVAKTEVWGAQGELGDEQRRLLSGILHGLREHNKRVKKIVVALHHHPFHRDIEWPGPDFPIATLHKLRDAEKLVDIVCGKPKAPKIDALVFGHAHVESRMEKKEKKYNIGLVYGAGQSTEPGDKGKYIIPIHDLSGTKYTSTQIQI